MSKGTCFDRRATRAAIDLAGLTARNQKFVASWFSAWQGDHLPAPASFSPKRLQKLRRLVQICAVQPDAKSDIIFEGREITRICGARPATFNCLAFESPRNSAARMRRMASIAEGALLRTIRQVRLKRGGKYRFEAISVPLCSDANGTVQIATFLDWNPPDKNAVLFDAKQFTKAPALAEFIPIVRMEPAGAPGKTKAHELGNEERVKVISQAAVRFVMNFMREAVKTYAFVGLDPADHLIAIAIDSMSIAHVDSDPNISRRHAGLIEPDWMRRGVSRAAVARMTHMPLETVRRRINQLVDKGILTERQDGIIVSSDNRTDFASRSGKMRFNARLVEALMDDLEARGVFLR